MGEETKRKRCRRRSTSTINDRTHNLYPHVLLQPGASSTAIHLLHQAHTTDHLLEGNLRAYMSDTRVLEDIHYPWILNLDNESVSLTVLAQDKIYCCWLRNTGMPRKGRQSGTGKHGARVLTVKRPRWLIMVGLGVALVRFEFDQQQLVIRVLT